MEGADPSDPESNDVSLTRKDKKDSSSSVFCSKHMCGYWSASSWAWRSMSFCFPATLMEEMCSFCTASLILWKG